jgi:LuxR family maltose regulon positive regulatory protein
LTGAKEIVQKMENTAREYDVPSWIMNLMAAWQGRIWLAEAKLDAVAQWAQERGLDIAGELTYIREMEVMVLARLLIAQGRLDEATKLLQRLLETVEPRGHTWREIEILSLQALASQAAGEPGRALTTLERALTLAEPGGLIRTFVDEGPPMARLLEQLQRRRVAVNYVTQILAAFETTDGVDPGIADAGIRAQTRQTTLDPLSALVEPLSERELKVLQLIAEGLTNQEVASRLFLSLNTVKAHTRNIYGKLGVHSRTQAVARARALGFLPFT